MKKQNYNQIPKIIFTDIDGVWTDGGMYYTENGIELKQFNTLDSLGVLIAKHFNVEIVILTGENSILVKNRAKKLRIKNCFLGVENKLLIAEKLCKKRNIKLSECAFIGDSLNDFELLLKVGYSGAPKNTLTFIKKNVNYVTKIDSGKGAFYDFVYKILIKDEEKIFKEIIKLNYAK